MTNKRGPKSQTLIMVPLSELVSKLPAGSNIKISRVWYESIQETLGLSEPSPFPEGIPTTDSGTIIEDKIHVESLDLSESE